jgi:hypothetical protein
MVTQLHHNSQVEAAVYNEQEALDGACSASSSELETCT